MLLYNIEMKSNNAKILATIVVAMGLLTMAVVPNVMAAMPDMKDVQKGTQLATENAQILRELTTMINDCTDDVTSYQFQIFDKCLQFMTDYNTSLKQLQDKYPETKGATSGLNSYDLKNFLRNQYLN